MAVSCGLFVLVCVTSGLLLPSSKPSVPGVIAAVSSGVCVCVSHASTCLHAWDAVIMSILMSRSVKSVCHFGISFDWLIFFFPPNYGL